MATGSPKKIPGIPFLPGNTYVDPTVTNFKKSHAFDFKAQMRTVQDEKPAIGGVPKPGFQPSSRLTATAQSLASTLARQASIEDDAPALPAWVAFDRKVLRFDAYFKESVHESNTETYRVRLCVIYYYLEDDSIHVAEPKRENSGIPQGVFLKRHRVPKAANPNDFFTLQDLNIGTEVTFYGRTFRIYNCDPFTRSFYEKLGIELGEPEEAPSDAYQTLRTVMTAKLKGRAGGPPKPKDDDLTRFMEAKLGKAAGILREDTLEQFLKNDRKVLRFYCVWDDRNALYGEKRSFILHYYLADDTIEILEVNKANSGRDPFPLLLRRQKLPKILDTALVSHETGESEFSVPGQSIMQTGFYKDRDLGVGKVITVFKRPFLLYDADPFTREYYKRQYGIADWSPLDIREEEPAPPTMDRPPYNGFGSDEDSLGSFIYLIPKVPKKDFKKIMENDRKILRFTARMVTTAPEDIARRFIVSYYLADDTVGVYEPPKRNSGIIGGKFLERMRMRLPDREDYYEVHQFTVGAELLMHFHKFQLLEADDYSLRFMEQNPRLFPHAVPNTWFERLRAIVGGAMPAEAAGVFQQLDTDRDGFIDKREMRAAAAAAGAKFSEQEIASIVFHWDEDGDGKINLEEFVRLLKDISS
eukprot:tig00021582_g22628.t1